jgi:hypothetical protein
VEAPESIKSDVKREHDVFFAKRSAVTRLISERDASPVEDIDRTDNIQNELVRFFVTANVPFRAAENPHLQRMFDVAKSSGFRVPSRRLLSGAILDRVSLDCNDMNEDSFKAALASSGCTVASDGWSTRTSINFINFMLVSAGKEAFHSCLFDGAYKKAVNIAEATAAVIDNVGADNVVQVTMDGAARHSFKFLRTKYPKVFFTWCSAHVLDLFLEDIGRDGFIANKLSECDKLIALFMNHQALLDALRLRCGKGLIRHAVTRFATYYLCMDRIIQCREVLLGLLASSEFQSFSSSQPPAARMASNQIRELVGNVQWFTWIERIHALMKPIFVLLRLVDGPACGLAGKLYYRMYLLQEQLAAEGSDSLLYLFPQTTKEHVRKSLQARWKNIHNPIYSIGFLLDPEFSDVSIYGQYQNNEVMSNWHDTVSTLFPDRESGM